MTTARRAQDSPDTADNSFADVLHAAAPDIARKSRLELYAFLVGRWALEVKSITEDGKTYSGRGEIYAGWCFGDAPFRMCG